MSHEQLLSKFRYHSDLSIDAEANENWSDMVHEAALADLAFAQLIRLEPLPAQQPQEEPFPLVRRLARAS